MTVNELRQMFASQQWPEFRALTVQENQVLLSIFIQPEIIWFTGHFPDQPVLPGVVQTHWAAELGKYFMGVDDSFTRIDNLKFQSPILPGQALDLMLQLSSDKTSVKFSYRTVNAVYSEGRLVF